MTSFAIWMFAGFCSGYVPTDADMTRYLCKSQFEASLRVFEQPKIPSYPDYPYRARPEIELTYLMPDRRLWRR